VRLAGAGLRDEDHRDQFLVSEEGIERKGGLTCPASTRAMAMRAAFVGASRTISRLTSSFCAWGLGGVALATSNFAPAGSRMRTSRRASPWRRSASSPPFVSMAARVCIVQATALAGASSTSSWTTTLLPPTSAMPRHHRLAWR